ncbi:MAG: MerR family transcriptional regulator [Bacillus sp. (in: Bacteria)]|nr:MerR family transcriptional regulator [Bacillus sp. (in: firmicutes)]
MPVKKSEDSEYLISDLVEEFNISQRTIRYYEELGLIHPRRTAGNHRIYTKKDGARIKMILRGKNLGFSLQDAACLIKLAELDSKQTIQYEEGIKLAYKQLKEVHLRREELKLLEDELLGVIEDAENKYLALKRIELRNE